MMEEPVPANPHPAVQGKPDVLDQLEDFFADPMLTGAIASFAGDHCHEIVPLAEGESYPLRYHDLYLMYTTMLEEKLASFLEEHGVTLEQLEQAARQGSGAHTCIDYLLASTEFTAFLQLMHDFNSMSQWDVEDEGPLE